MSYVVETAPVRLFQPAAEAGPERETEPSVFDQAFRLLLWGAVYAVAGVAAMRPVTDPDVWFHLRAGQWMWEHGTVLTSDPFSTFGLGRYCPCYSWLFEVLIYGVYQSFGLFGIILYRVVLSLAIVAMIHRLVARREERFLPALGMVGLAVIALVPILSERPWLFTILFSAWTLDVILDYRAGKNTGWSWLLPVGYVLWANIHIQFIYGLFLLALACAAPVFDRVFKRSHDDIARAGSRSWWTMVLLASCCFLATLLTPFHVHLYSVILQYGSQPAVFQLVAELKAMAFRQPWDWAALVLTGAAAFALGRRSRLDTFEVLLLASTAYFSFRSQRDVWFVVLAALAILARTGRMNPRLEECFPLNRLRIGILVGSLALVLLATALVRQLSSHNLWAKVTQEFPAAAAAVVETNGYAGPIYNHFDWGNYLIWRLPNMPVAIDGRTNVHGDERVARFEATWRGQPGWDADPDLAAAGTVIAQREIPLASLLKFDPRFEMVHEDSVAVVFINKNKEPQINTDEHR